ncbi:MAG: hypothetical protein Kow00124_23990 [Anaerolineae bacterium]
MSVTQRIFRWHIRLISTTTPTDFIDIEFDDEALLGIGEQSPYAGDLRHLKAHERGVSRTHAQISVIDWKLYIADTGSTNGTTLNGEKLTPGQLYPLKDNDLLSLGALDLSVIILEGVHSGNGRGSQGDLADALAQMAQAITSQLDPDEVLGQVLEMTMSLTAAGEAAIWLLDPGTNDLFLEAARGLQDEGVRRMRIPAGDSLAGVALTSGRPIRAGRDPEGDPIKVKTGYFVEAVLYIPLIHGENKLGVLAAVHREAGNTFSARDEKLLESIGDFAAIAIHNAQLYRKLQEADRLKREMIQNISHEFRTPLQFIMGYMGLLLEERERLAPEHYAYVETVERQARRLAWLVDNFVMLETLEGTVAKRMPTEVSDLLSRAAQTAHLLAVEKGIDLSWEMEGDLPQAMVNPMTVFQVLDNLIANAIKFTPPGGSVRLTAVHDPAHDVIVVTVTDTGIGIAPEEHERIFERFYQVDGSATRAHGGVGLGLSVCKAIVEEHGGRIWVESAPGEGAAFHFTLPVATENEFVIEP